MWDISPDLEAGLRELEKCYRLLLASHFTEDRSTGSGRYFRFQCAFCTTAGGEKCGLQCRDNLGN